MWKPRHGFEYGATISDKVLFQSWKKCDGNSPNGNCSLWGPRTIPFECSPMVWTISWWTRRHWRRPQKWPAYKVSQWQQCREDFSVLASKPSPFAKNASRRGEHWQGHNEKDCSWRFAKTEDLFALFPHSLTPVQKDRRIAACRDLIATPDFFKKIVTGDETWYFAYDPTNKRQSAAWVGETSPRPKKKLRFQKSRLKIMLVIFFDWQGVIHKEFVPKGETINAVYYKGVMERLLNRIRRVRPDMCESGDWFPLHDNAPSNNRQAVFGPKKSDCARPPSVFARLSTCWLLFVPKSEIPLEGASLWLDFGHPESRDNCKRRLLQRHPEAVWPCKSVCTVRRDVCRKLNNTSVIYLKQILFIMPVLKLGRRTVYYHHYYYYRYEFYSHCHRYCFLWCNST